MTEKSPATLRELLEGSGALWRDSALQALALVACAAVPATLLLGAALAATGLTTQVALNEAIRAGHWRLAVPVLAAGLIQRLAITFAYAAMVFSIEAKRVGRPLPLSEAFGYAAERFLPLVLALLRAAVWIAGGLILLVIPGVILAVRYAYVHLAVLLDAANGGDALRRSAQFVDAEPRRAAGYLFVAVFAAAAMSFVAILIVSTACALPRAMAAQPGAVEGQFEILLSQLASGLVGAWLTSFAILLYRDLATRHPAPHQALV